MKLGTVLRREGHTLLRGHTPLILIIFLLPLFFSILFGMVYHENVVKNIPLVIYDQDQSSASRTLIQAYADSERFKIVAHVDTQEAMESAIYTGEAQAALGIPADFSKHIKQGTGTDIMLMVNSANNMFANAALSAAQEINRTISVGVGQRLTEGLGLLPKDAMNSVYPVRLGVRIVNNPANGYTPFMLSGLMLNGLQIALMLVAGPLVIREIRRASYGRSFPSRLVFVGKGLCCWTAAMLSFALSMSVLYGFFDVPVRGSFFDIALIGGCFCYFVISVLFLFSAFAPDEVMSMQAPLLYIMPGLLFSGLSWPAFSMNLESSLFAALLPMVYAADTLRDILLAGYAPDLWSNAASMVGLGTGCALLAGLIFSYRRFHSPKEQSAALLQRLRRKVQKGKVSP